MVSARTRSLLLEEISRYQQEVGYAPTVRELAAAVGVPVSTVQYHLTRMIKDGLVRRDSGKSRSVRVVA